MVSSVTFDISIKGCDEISALLRQLPDRLREQYGRRALEAAAEITEMAVRARTPVDSGAALASIDHTRINYYEASGSLFTAVEPRKGCSKVEPRKYFHLIERGRKALAPIKGKVLVSNAGDADERFFTHAKAVAGHPVFGPARDATAQSAVIAMEVELAKGVAEFNQTEVGSGQ